MMMSYLSSSRFYKVFLKPRAGDKDQARKEFILRVLLLGVCTLSFISFLVILVNMTVFGSSYDGASPFHLFAVFLLFLFLYVMVLYGYYTRIAVLFLMALIVPTIMISVKWGSLLPQAVLMYSLIIVMSGILVNASLAIWMAGGISVFILGLSYAQSTGIVVYDDSWRSTIYNVSDAFTASITFLIMAVVTWLFNSELENSLKRVRQSETALRNQRQLLETKVAEKTQELRRAHLENLLEVYRFAEFGKLASGIFHDLSSPLTTISLNLELLDVKSEQLQTDNHFQRAVRGIHQMNDFFQAARKQIQKQDVKVVFTVQEEIEQVMAVMSHKALLHDVEVQFRGQLSKPIVFFGNVFKFHQVFCNLISNAIDAYMKLDFEEKKIVVTVKQQLPFVQITVQDWGSGIDDTVVKKIFQPLFTTKSEHGSGLGLYITKNIITKDFLGDITVDSKLGKGSIFTVTIPVSQKEAHQFKGREKE